MMFSNRVPPHAEINPLSRTIASLQAAGARIIDLTESNPTTVGLDYPAGWLDVLGAEHVLRYAPQSLGLAVAREAVAADYARRGTRVDPTQVVLSASSSEAYSWLFKLLCNPGEAVLVPQPSYPLFDLLADLQDVKLVPYPLLYDHGWQVDFHSLENSIGPTTRAMVLVNPNNPTGSYVSTGEREQLNEICRRHKLALIVDEVFLDYALDGSEHTSFSTNQDALTFTLSGLSKISALPQMKLAWIAVNGPKEQAHCAMERLEVIADTYLSVSAPVQFAAPALLAERETVQSQIRERVRANLEELDRQLLQQKTCSRLAVQGGWYVVLRVPVTQSDEDLAIALLREKNVLVHPGHFYDFPQDGFLILSLIASQLDFRSGLQTLFDHSNAI